MKTPEDRKQDDMIGAALGLGPGRWVKVKTKVKARYANGEIVEMIIYGPAKIGDRVRNAGSDAVAYVIEILGSVE